MLDAMHVHVWWPRALPAGASSDAVAAPDRVGLRGPGSATARAQALSPVQVQAKPHGQSSPQFQRRPVPEPEPQLPVAVQASPLAAAREIAAPLPAAALQHPTQHESPDWDALTATIADCTLCQLSAGRRAAVFQPESAARQADWLVVGEPPDAQEERAGAPFVAAAGQLLDNMLRAVGVTRNGSGASGARITSVVKCRPAVARNPQPGELATCAAYLRREIALVRPKVILAMGRFAALSLLSEGNPELLALPFAKWRGQLHRYQGVPVVVTYHPSVLLRAQEDKAQAWADLCLAMEVATGAGRGGQVLH